MTPSSRAWALSRKSSRSIPSRELGPHGPDRSRSNPDLQRVLDAMIATKTVLRSSSVIVLNTHFQGRTLPLLEAAAAM